MTGIADSRGNGESKWARAMRLQQRAELYRAIADDAWSECQRAYRRAEDAESRASDAEREFSLAFHAWQAEEAGVWAS